MRTFTERLRREPHLRRADHCRRELSWVLPMKRRQAALLIDERVASRATMQDADPGGICGPRTGHDRLHLLCKDCCGVDPLRPPRTSRRRER